MKNVQETEDIFKIYLQMNKGDEGTEYLLKSLMAETLEVSIEEVDEILKSNLIPCHVYNIDWDIDEEDSDEDINLPDVVEIGIPKEIYEEYGDVDIDTYIGDILSDKYGFCINSFSFDILTDDIIYHVYDINWDIDEDDKDKNVFLLYANCSHGEQFPI